ncbi:MAG: hypothetical protein ACOCZE_11360 [Planctomycetota bacterium]
MHEIWAVARQTVLQSIRTKIVPLFLVLLAVVLGLLPMAMSGDGTQAGKVQSFLSYSVSAIAVLLSIVTVLLTVHVLSSDVEQKFVMTVATKPVARWQYVLGRWVGVVLLNAVFVLIAGAAAYGQVQYMRHAGQMNPQDRQKIESEIFVARRQVDPVGLNVRELLEARIDTLRQQGRLEPALDRFEAETQGDREAAGRLLQEEIVNAILAEKQSVAPAVYSPRTGLREGGSLTWQFQGLDVQGEAVSRQTEILDSVLDERQVSRQSTRKFLAVRLEADQALIGRLVRGGPVTINGDDWTVLRISSEGIEAVRPLPAGWPERLPQNLATGREVAVVAEPVLQVQYKITPAGQYDFNEVFGRWVVTNPQASARYRVYRTDARDAKLTLTVPARMVDSDGKMTVTFTNLAPASMRINEADVAVMVPAGGFTMNFARSIFLIWVQLAFMAAIGICFGSFLGFAVGVVASFSVLPFGLFREYLTEATRTFQDPSGQTSLFGLLTKGVMFVMEILLPDLESTGTSEQLVDGLVIPWGDVASATFWVLLVRSTLLVGLGCWIWQRRELSNVQV